MCGDVRMRGSFLKVGYAWERRRGAAIVMIHTSKLPPLMASQEYQNVYFINFHPGVKQIN